MIKVKSQYYINMYEKGGEYETTEFEFEDGTSQKEIDEFIQDDFWVWMSNTIGFGWNIESIERIEQ